MTTTEEDIIAAIEKLDAYIRKHRIRQSAERRMILEKIMRLDAHFTARSLHSLMQGAERVSLATVYNTLELLQKAGLIVKHPFAEPEYETTARSRTHHHRICIQCGAIKEFSDQKMEKAIKQRTFSAFAPEYSSLYLYGLCKKCMPRQKKNRASASTSGRK